MKGSNFSAELPLYIQISEALKLSVEEDNGGFGFHMWVTLVNRDGVVKVVAFSGDDRGDQWPGSRVISAQKAYTANAFSLPKFALSTANLYSAVQPGGSLYGLQFSNPVAAEAAYLGPFENIGTNNDPLVGHKIGGINVFGGGLALYDSYGDIVGAIGVSGDSSCADHVIAWKIRHHLKLDYVPAGVSVTNDDNIMFDIDELGSAGGWGHPECSPEVAKVAMRLPETHPLSSS